VRALPAAVTKRRRITRAEPGEPIAWEVGTTAQYRAISSKAALVALGRATLSGPDCHHRVEDVMLQRNDADVPRSDFEAWRVLFRASVSAQYAMECAEPNVFAGWMRPLNISGFSALDIACNKNRIERTQRHIRLDGVDYYGVLVQVAGRSKLSHNGQALHLGEGDVMLIDKAQPASHVFDERVRCLYIPFPRRPLISHLGFEPRGGSYRPADTPAARLLHEFVLNALKENDAQLSPADVHMQHAIYSLIGALFVPDSWCGSRPTDKLFGRIRAIIRDHLADPDFGPQELAAAAGISLRYVHKLFTERGFSCLEFIYSHRLERAAQLLNRRPGKAQQLAEIARVCGFRDYTHFARKFRHRFGCSPASINGADTTILCPPTSHD
jgi:AraC family transcriptional activator of tynA and feaB